MKTILNSILNFFSISENNFVEKNFPKLKPFKELRIDKKFFYYLSLLLLIFFNFIIILNIDFLYIREIFSLLFLLIMPGTLIVLGLNIKNIELIKYLFLIIGLSVSFLSFLGLFINWLLPLIKISYEPLSLIYSLISFNISYILIMIFSFYGNNVKYYYKFQVYQINILNSIIILLSFMIPLMGIIGTFLLNNHYDNIVIMITLFLIGIVVFLNTIFRKNINGSSLAFSIWMISLTILLIYSLRSWQIFGADIFREYEVFQLTLQSFHWDINNFPGNNYNSCISITILPTLIYVLTNIEPQFIFKFIFQIIFSFTPVILFYFFKNYFNNILAFLSSFFFISTSQYITEFPILARQEISLFYFVLLIYILFENNINSFNTKLLLIIFGFSMIISHYSTTYIAIAIILFSFMLFIIFTYLNNKNLYQFLFNRKNNNVNEIFNPLILLILVLSTFMWQFQLTETSNHLIDSLEETVSNIHKSFEDDLREESTSPFAQFNIFYKPRESSVLFANYTEDLKNKYTYLEINNYDTEEFSDYSLRPLYSNPLDLNVPLNVASKIYLGLEIIKKSIKFFILIGVGYILINFFRKKKDIDYTTFVISCTFLLLLMIILPIINLKYPLSRFYQQTLVFLSISGILGLILLLRFFGDRFRNILISIFFIIYFLFMSGFLFQLIGGITPPLQLNNDGIYYDGSYTHFEEYRATNWFKENYIENILIFADRYGERKLWAFAQINQNIVTTVIPHLIDKNSYVYLTYTNDIERRGSEEILGRSGTYSVPTVFLNNNKNKIYNNGGSEILK